MAQATSDNLESEIRSLVASILEIDETKIDTNMRFVEELGMDSMMALEILASVEKKYKIRIPEENIAKVSSLGSMVEITRRIIGGK